ncbi:transporter substrate-binding domain-containing protein [Colwellia sp. 1_MG-2023]|uniref:substrate-binding periplasmic protein n=1 Tax=Colwellia sp. 1_MG-2023 TaxID=3062649 RepID=UPI0026E26A2C|nr:transporter substrate-binding domain-containing protein [Colwellia sp. 1_MG-2023]MDO6446882.1 transporter substrate-binding domain-containing protein [Colwellia sp. 1_MG-2023]
MNKISLKQFTLSFISLFFILLSLSFNSFNSNASEQENDADLSKISIATGSQFYPYVDAKLPKNGWSSAIVQAVFEHLKIKHDIHVFPWIRVSELTKQNIHDGAYPYAKTLERKEEFYFSQPINFVPVKILLRKSIADQKIENLKHFTFCIPLGYVPPTELLKVISVENTTSAQSTNDCLKKIKVGWADIVVYNQFNELSDSFIGEDLKWSTLELASEPLFFIVSKTHPNGSKIIQLFNQGLTEITNNKTLEKINEQYESIIHIQNLLLNNDPKSINQVNTDQVNKVNLNKDHKQNQ